VNISGRKNGFLLIFALWTLGLLSILAVSVATGVRQKIMLVEKLDGRSRLSYLLQSASAATRAMVQKQLAGSGFFCIPPP
jgi:hypothetical protein